MQILSVFIASILVLVAISAILALPVMFLWNLVIPQIFGLPEVTWMQAWALSLLCGLLFKSNVTTKKGILLLRTLIFLAEFSSTFRLTFNMTHSGILTML